MISCSGRIELRRCRPLLGTFVEITAAGLPEAKLAAAIDSAFRAIEKIQRLMSAHDPASELSALNHFAAARPVTVSRETFTVLRRAAALAAASRGAFDHTIAPTLARWGLLPRRLAHPKTGTWRDILLQPGRAVRFQQPLALDLGGIAKGYAVDRAIAALRRHRVASAVVNAGGDLRAFGPAPSTIGVRHPAFPGTLAGRVQIQDAALATSSPCFTERPWRGRRVSHLVNPARAAAVTGAISVSVRAPECWLADALTKVVLNSPAPVAKMLLARYGADAFILAGVKRRGLQLSSRHRRTVYAVGLLLLLSGAAWASLHRLDEAGQGGDTLRQWKSGLIALHGYAAAGFVLLLGTLIPVHIRHSWHARKNRANGAFFLIAISLLTLSGYMLYYLGNETARHAASILHLWLGLASPALLCWHIWSGRKSARS